MNTNKQIQVQSKLLMSTLFKFLIKEHEDNANVTVELQFSPKDIGDLIEGYSEGWIIVDFVKNKHTPSLYINGEVLFAPSKLQLHIASITDCFVKEQPFDIPKLLGRF